MKITPGLEQHGNVTAQLPHTAKPLGEIALTDGQQRFGRAAVLWQDGDRRVLLTSVRKASGESLTLYDVSNPEAPLPLPIEPERADRASSAGAALGHDTLTCLRWVGGGCVLMGLRRWSGDADIELLTISIPTGRNEPRRGIVRRRSIRLRDARGASIPNAVHSVHFDNQGGTLRVVAGCDDGGVYLVDGLEFHNPHALPQPARRIARMTAPVWSIRCRSLANGRLRVFGGTADGHIVAWQELDDRQFPCLWSTREAGAIVAIWAFEACLDEDPAAGIPVVLAVSRNGRAVLLSDRDEIDPHARDDKTIRPRAPGQRLERFKLRSSAFSAANLLVPRASAAGDEPTRLTPVARLLVVTGESVVRLVALHQPKRSEIRRQRYGKLGDRWWYSLGGEATSRKAIQPHRLRYPEALRGLAPAVWLLPISFFFDDERETRGVPLRQISAGWYPRYLRNYVRAVHAHRFLTSALVQDDPVSAGNVEAQRIALESTIRGALMDAHEIGDKFLFEEIILNLERHFNPTILAACARATGRDETLLEVYRTLLDALEQACRAWLATDVETYGQVQAVRIKNLVDGHVLYTLAMSQAGRPHLGELVNLRLQHVQRLLRDGNPLIPLETLRTVNFSLLRACWFLNDEDPPWPNLKTFVDILGAFSAQAATHASDALAHEITRVHALCVMLAPHEAIRIALNMRAGRLPLPIVEATRSQLRLVGGLLSSANKPEIAQRRECGIAVFEHCLELPPRWSELLGTLEETKKRCGATSTNTVALENEMRGWCDAYKPCSLASSALREATQHLRNAPERVSFEAIARLKHQLRAVPAQPGDKWDHFSRDRAYFITRLDELERVCQTCNVPTSEQSESPATAEPQPRQPSPERTAAELAEEQRPVAPAVVLASHAMCRWARHAREELPGSGVAEPQYSLYFKDLSEFEAVTGNLRTSSAVQRRLVTGVLGHHLMEALDEHVLRLSETAHVLYPGQLFSDEERAHLDEASGILSQHARVLGQQAEQARTIPKNLRSLYQLLSAARPPLGREHDDAVGSPAEPDVPERTVSVWAIFEQAFRTEYPNCQPVDDTRSRPSVSPMVAASLGLIFGELASNHRVHSGLGGDVVLSNHNSFRSLQLQVVLRVREPSSGRLDGLVDVARTRMQRFSRQAEGVEESSGVGLYLANLAASIVGWEIKFRGQDKLCSAYPGTSTLTKDAYRKAAELLVFNGTISYELFEVPLKNVATERGTP